MTRRIVAIISFLIITANLWIHKMKWFPEDMYIPWITTSELLYKTILSIIILSIGVFIGIEWLTRGLRGTLGLWLSYGYDTRRNAVWAINILVLIIISLLFQQPDIANNLAIILYYILIVIVITNILPERPRKWEEKLQTYVYTTITPYFEKRIKVLNKNIKINQTTLNIHTIMHDWFVLRIQGLIFIVNLIILKKHLSNQIVRKNSYRIWISISILWVVYYSIVYGLKWQKDKKR